MRTELLQRRCENARASLNGDNLSEFSEMIQIARLALSEVVLLRQEMQEIIKTIDEYPLAGAAMSKHIADMALRRAE